MKFQLVCPIVLKGGDVRREEHGIILTVGRS